MGNFSIERDWNMNEELMHRFKYHPPSNQGVADDHGRIRGEFMTLAASMDELLPEGREKSLVMTNLEQAMMWANASIARNQ